MRSTSSRSCKRSSERKSRATLWPLRPLISVSPVGHIRYGCGARWCHVCHRCHAVPHMPQGARWCHMVPQVARRCGTAVAARLARLETTPRGLLETRSTYRSESKATERVERRRGLGPNTTRTHRPKCGQRPCHPGLAKCRHQPTPAGAFSDLSNFVSQQVNLFFYSTALGTQSTPFGFVLWPSRARGRPLS